MKKRFSDKQIISILREAEAGVSAHELCRKHAISDATFYTWRKKYGGMLVLLYGQVSGKVMAAREVTGTTGGKTESSMSSPPEQIAAAK
ncbi:IS3 family transposase orfA [Enterobacter kobei]|nr:IS3 family transposase orfA [Enterobacter kobei]